MDKIEKFLRKLPKKEQKAIAALMILLKQRKFQGLDIVKITGTNYLRVRVGRFRIIFRYKSDKDIHIKYIRIRDDKTYKNL